MAFAIVSQPTAALQQRSAVRQQRRASLVVRATAQPIINPDIRKEEPKVVDMISGQDINGKVGRAHLPKLH